MAWLTLSDFREAARGLRRAPALTISAVTCLALGLGVTTDISSAVDRVLLQRLQYEAPEELVTIYRETPHFDTGPFSNANFIDLAQSTRRLSSVAAITPTSILISQSSEGLKTTGHRVSGNIFATLGVHALRGRLLTPDDDAADQPPVAVISEELWRNQFAADASMLGRNLVMNGVSYEVVGILPKDFRVVQGGRIMRSDVWIPLRLTADELSQRGSNYLMLLGRLAPGATPALAHEELRSIFAGIVERFPTLRGENVRVLALQEESTRSVRTPLLLMLGAVGIVLLIAATNVASLLLARGVQRRREMAVRTALGGDRWSVMRPVVAESILLALAGLGLGLFFAWVGIKSMGALASQRIPQLQGLTMDLRIVGFATILSLFVSVLCAAVPAWRSASADPQDALRSGRGGGMDRMNQRLLATLVVAEVALSLVLLVGAGLVLKGFVSLMSQDPGFEASSIITLEATVPPERYPDGTALKRFLEPALSSIEQVPGVAAAGSISLLPYDNWGWNYNIRYEGQPGNDPARLPITEIRYITPGFFGVTEQQLVRGRLLEQSDSDRPSEAPAVVVNEALVARDFKDADPIGKRFHMGDNAMATIVGVVSDIRNAGPFSQPRPETYFHYSWGGWGTAYPIVVRVRQGQPDDVIPAIRAALRGLDPQVAVTRVVTMPDVIARSVGRPRFYLSLLGVFAVVAVALALGGVYGVMNYAVVQRTREFGIRTALGSSPVRTAGLVTRQGMVLVATGIAIGAIVATMTTRLLQGFLYGVSPLDLKTWIAAVLALAGAALLATLVPAVRSTRVDPMIAIREE